MNERIKELSEQARYAIEREGILLELVLEEFAKLIVRECASQAAQWTPAGDQGAEEQEKYILKHFGVE